MQINVVKVDKILSSNLFSRERIQLTNCSSVLTRKSGENFPIAFLFLLLLPIQPGTNSYQTDQAQNDDGVGLQGQKYLDRFASAASVPVLFNVYIFFQYIEIHWTRPRDIANADFCAIEYKDNQISIIIPVGKDENSHLISGLQTETRYKFRLYCFYGNTRGPPTEWFFATTRTGTRKICSFMFGFYDPTTDGVIQKRNLLLRSYLKHQRMHKPWLTRQVGLSLRYKSFELVHILRYNLCCLSWFLLYSLMFLRFVSYQKSTSHG